MFISYILCHPMLSPDKHVSSSGTLWRHWSFNKYNPGKWGKLNPNTDLWKSYNGEEKIHLQMSKPPFFFFFKSLLLCSKFPFYNIRFGETCFEKH